MSNRLYLVPLPDAKAFTSDEGIRAQIQQAGLLQQGGTATEKIAAENIDLVVNGRYDYGATFSQKVADELESLGESEYSGLPYYAPTASDSGRNKGYYELRQVDVNPAHPNTRDTFEYTAGLSFKGTTGDLWRAIKTNVETINTGLATGSDGLIGIPETARKVRWFDSGAGKESATVDSTVNAEFGDVDLFDPTEPTFDNPTLLYEVDFSDESPVDVRVFDDKGVDKYYRSGGDAYDTGDYGIGPYGTAIYANQWTHVFHSAFEFDGNAVVDNGLIRIVFNEDTQALEIEEFGVGGGSWEDISIDQTDYDLIDADLGGIGTSKIGPSAVDVYCEFEDTSTGAIEPLVMSIQRGLADVVIRETDNETIPTDLENMLDPIASNQTTDAQPTQTLKARSEVK